MTANGSRPCSRSEGPAGGGGVRHRLALRSADGSITALTVGGRSRRPATAATFAVWRTCTRFDEALPARWAANGRGWRTTAIYNRIRQFDTVGGSALWGQRRRRPIVRNSWDAPVRGGGDGRPSPRGHRGQLCSRVRQLLDNYVIADRVGMSIEFIPHLFGGNRRPTGQRGWYAYYRVGANVVDRAPSGAQRRHLGLITAYRGRNSGPGRATPSSGPNSWLLCVRSNGIYTDHQRRSPDHSCRGSARRERSVCRQAPHAVRDRLVPPRPACPASRQLLLSPARSGRALGAARREGGGGLG